MERRRILLCAGTGCISSGSLAVKEALLNELEKRGIADQFEIVTSGCHGFCEQGPL